MEKVYKLVEILDEKTVRDLIYLDRLVRFYAKFLETWRNVEVTSNGTVVRVKFFRVSKDKLVSFTEREFPMEDIGKRITSYKGKIKREFTKRHDNPRIQRAKKVRAWENYLKEGGILDADV